MFGLGAISGKKKESKKDAERAERDRLRADALASAERALLSSAGIPGTADALAFEPTQGLIGIATSDGKIKLFGRPGCELTLYSAAKYPYATRQLQFLQNRGVIMRVSKGGFMESWSVASADRTGVGARPLGTLKVRGDKICCVADMARDPYVLLGCASGSLRIAMLVDAAGSPTAQPRQARAFSVAPYRVRPEELCGAGEVRQLAVQSFGGVHRALVLFTAGVVAVWDLRAAQLTTSIDSGDEATAAATPALAAAGQATAVCWIGTSRGDFATGHVDGSVLVWALPGLDPGQAALAAVMRVVAGEAEPVRALRCVFGEADAAGLLALGGQQVEQPEGLTLLPLPGGPDEEGAAHADDSEEDEDEEEEEEEEEEAAGSHGRSGTRRAAGRRVPQRRGVAAPRRRQESGPVKLPWFGHIIGFCLVVDGGSVTGYEAPSSVLQLAEGGQLILHRLQGQQQLKPLVVTPPFQQRAAITATEAALVPLHKPAACGPSTITLSGLRQVAADSGDEGDPYLEGMAAFHCGTPPPVPPGATWGLVYCTGYKDGGVGLWDLHGGTSRLLCAAPAGDAADASRLGGRGGSAGSVTCLSLVWPTGLLLVGHQKGEVRMYQFSASERQVECVSLESVNTPGVCRPLRQPAGLQLRLRVLVNSGEITSLAYCQSIRAVAAGDKAGGVALVDTARPAVRWYALPSQHAILAAAIAPLPLPPARARTAEVAGEEGAPSHTVVVTDSQGCLAALDAARGCFVGRGGPLHPKNSSCSLALELLDERCCPLWARQQLGAGCDQAALGGAPAAPASAGSKRGSPAAGGSRRRVHDSEGEENEDEEEEEEGEEEGDLDADELDVDALLARAALQVEAGGSPPRGGHGSRAKSREASRRTGQGATESRGGAHDDLEGAPAALSTCPDPTAHYVLLVTDQYLRLYSAANVLLADRATAAKRSPAAHQQLVYARPLQGPGGVPGVLALAAAEHGLSVQLYSLPSLELLHEAPLSASLSWYWDVPAGHERLLGRLAATSRLGHLLLLGLGNELFTLGLTAGLPPPAAPVGLFDAGAAAAALAAAAEFEAENLQAMGRLGRAAQADPRVTAEEVPQHALDSESSERIDGVDSPAFRTEGRRVDKGPAAAAAATAATAAATAAAPRVAAEKAAERVADAAKEANVTLTRVFNRVQQGLTRGVRQLATNVERGVASVQAALVDGAAMSGGGAGGGGAAGMRPPAAGGPRSAEWYASLPDLGAVFSHTVPEDDAASARMRRKQQRQQKGGGGGAGGGGAGGVEEEEDDISILSITDDEDEEHGGGAPAQQRGGAAGHPMAAGAMNPPPPRPVQQQHPQQQQQQAPRSAGGNEASMRADLFGGARPHASAGGGGASSAGGSQPRTRTADEIKRAYGRAPAEGGRAGAAAARAHDVHAVMEETRGRLEERGERLRRLDDKAADLENSAAGFAEMARQLAERERNKKWWQL